MKRLLAFAILLFLPMGAFAKGYARVAVKIAPETGIINGVMDIGDKKTEFSFDLKDADYNDGHTFVIYRQWLPDIPEGYGVHLYISLPDEYITVTESNRSYQTPAGMSYEFDNPNERITLAFSDQWIKTNTNYNGIGISTYFTGKNQQFSGLYISRIKELLDMYVPLLGEYPYSSFNVVEVPYPAGHALTSMTFISGSIIGMPFLTEVSLGYELVHQWLGVGVKADYESGNWAEGLTVYYADKLYAEQKGEGVDYRKNALQSIIANARQNEDGTCLMEFKYNQGRQSQAIGYAKSLMVFSMLENILGKDDFEESVRIFIKSYMHKTAEWEDIIKVMEDTAGVSLTGFINGWLGETAIAEFNVTDAQVNGALNGYSVSFDIKNKYKELEYPLEILVKTEDGETVYEYFYIYGESVNVEIKTESRPVKIVIDPEYKTARMLAESEMTPVLYHMFSKYKKVLFVKPEDERRYASVADALENIEVVSDSVNPALHSDSILIFAGEGNRAFEKMYRKPVPSFEGDFMVKGYQHPTGVDKMSYLIIGRDADTIKANMPRVNHYRNYSSLVLDGGHQFRKGIDSSDRGIEITLGNELQGVPVQKMLSIKEIVEQNKEKKVFVVGENHNNYAHHENQYEFLKLLKESGADVAVGLEMVQRPFQKYLDAYIKGDISQEEMLVKTEYYDRWRFDFRLYKRIFDYARAHSIPMVALNMEKEITKKISSKGIASLGDDGDKIPADIVYSGGGYKSFLKGIFAMHDMGMEFENFYEAQLIWDETMAESAAKYITANPGKTLVIIAGNGHVRYGRGIPDRLKRRTGLDNVIVVQDDEYKAGIADYILNPDEMGYDESPKIGVAIEDTDSGLLVKEVTKDSYAEKAGVMKDDYITEFNGRKIMKLADIKIALLYTEKGQDYQLKVNRAGEELTFSVSF